MFLKKNTNNVDTKAVRKELAAMLDRCSMIDAALAVTIDGHMIEKVESRSYPLKRIAAMGSSMMSLGDTMTAELQMGNCRNMIAENENGILAMMHINAQYVLVTITHETKGLGMLLSASRICAESLRAVL